MGSDRGTDPGTDRERRLVRSEDPSLTPEANRLLTDELREAVGRDEVEVPADTPARHRDAHGTHDSMVAAVIANRAIVLVTLLAALVVGTVVAFTTGQVWALLVAVGVHALGTMVVAGGTIQLTTETEHVAPETAARLEAEGVADPDRVLSELVEDFAGEQEAGGAAEVVSPGHDDRRVSTDDDPARSTMEQRTAMTPQAHPGPAGGDRSAIEALPWWLTAGVIVLSVALAPFLSQGWALPLVVVPLGLGWIAMQWWMARDGRLASERPTGDARGAQRRLVPLTVFVVAGAVWFLAVMQWFTGAF